MGLQNFGDNENWLGSFLVGGQPDDLDFEVSEDMEGLDEGGRHLGDDEDDEEACEFDEIWTTTIVRWTLHVYESA